MFQRFYTLARNTFIETVRQPIYGVILLVTAFLMIMNVSLAGFTLEDDDKLLLDLGLSTLLLSGLFLAAFSAAGVITREIENKTVLTVISKPVSRPVFILGKFAGLALALSLAFYLSFLVFVLALRHGVMENTTDPWDGPVLVFGFGSLVLSLAAAAFCNYFYGWFFPTTVLTFIAPLLTLSVLLLTKFDAHFESIEFLGDFVGGQVFLAGILVYFAVMFTTAVAVAAATRLGQVMTLIICTSVLGLGIISDYAFGPTAPSATEAGAAAAASSTAGSASLLYYVVPNIGPFWVIDGLQAASANTAVTFGYVGLNAAYAALLTLAALCMAVALFQRREVG